MANGFETESNARELADKSERGESLSTQLNSLPFQERLRMARSVQRLVDSDRQADPNIPQLELTAQTDQVGCEHLVDMTVKTGGGKVIDIYNLPGRIDSLNVSDQVKLNMDSSHSNYLKTGGREIYPSHT